MPPCLVENMAPLTDTVCFIIACLILSEYKPIQISWQTQSLLSGALTPDKRSCQTASHNASLWNSNTTQSMLSVLRNSGPKWHRGML